MTRFAIDAGVAIRLAQDDVPVAESHQLVAPKSLQSAVMAQLYGEVRAGTRDRDAARRILDTVTTMRLRLLGNRVRNAVRRRLTSEPGPRT